MGTITRTLANNITTGGVILPSGINNNSLSSVTSLPSGVGGKVLQVQSTTLTNNFTVTTSTSQTAITGLSVSITPASTSNKVLIMYKLMFSNSAGHGATFHLQRTPSGEYITHDTGSTGVRAFASGNVENSNNYWAFDWGGSHLDSPSSTSSLSYGLFVRFPTSNTIYFNRTARLSSEDVLGVSTITAMEIAG